MRYAIFLKEINLSIFSFFSYMRNLNYWHILTGPSIRMFKTSTASLWYAMRMVLK